MHANRNLADTDRDGKMNINEFSIACKLVNLKLRGFEMPKQLPPTMIASLTAVGSTPILTPTGNLSPVSGVAPGMLNGNCISQSKWCSIKFISCSFRIVIQPARPVLPPPPQLQQAAQPILAQPAQPALIGLTQPIMQAQQQQPPPIIPMTMPMQAAMPIIPNVQQQPIVPIVPIAPLVSQPAAPATNGALLIDSLVNIAPAAPAVPVAPIVPIQPSVEPIVPVQPVLPPPPTPPSGTQSRSMSFAAEKAPSIESPGSEWAVKGPSKLKFTQLFNTTDRTRSGFLTGAQARNLLMQSRLPQATLAQIWALSDIDSDGRLSCDEFVLAMYLCEIATQGETIPAKLPPELIPPSFRKTVSRHGSVAGSGPTSRHGSVSSQGGNANIDIDLHNYNQTTFEDKRKENFDKGQAELDRRRKVLQGKRLMA